MNEPHILSFTRIFTLIPHLRIEEMGRVAATFRSRWSGDGAGEEKAVIVVSKPYAVTLALSYNCAGTFLLRPPRIQSHTDIASALLLPYIYCKGQGRRHDCARLNARGAEKK